MDFSVTPEQEAFRQEFRVWLVANVPSEAKQLRHLQPQASETDLDFLRTWQRKVYDGGWAGLSWPCLGIKRALRWSAATRQPDLIPKHSRDRGHSSPRWL